MDAIAISTPREGNYSAIANAVTIRVYGQAQEMRRSASLVERNELEWREPADRAPSDPLQCFFNVTTQPDLRHSLAGRCVFGLGSRHAAPTPVAPRPA